MQRFQDLEVWRRGHELTMAVYSLSAKFPSAERFGLTAQLRRSMSSVPTNIAEGSKRSSNREYARFLNIAEASLAEAEYQLILCKDLHFAAEEDVANLLADVSLLAKKLYTLRRKVEGTHRAT